MFGNLKKWFEDRVNDATSFVGANKQTTSPQQLERERQVTQYNRNLQKQIRSGVESGKIDKNKAAGMFMNQSYGSSPSFNFERDVLYNNAPRSTTQQAVLPGLGSFAKGFAQTPANLATMAGTGIKAATPFDSIGESLQEFGKNQNQGIEDLYRASAFDTGTKEGENKVITGLSSGLGSLASSVAMAKTGGLKAGKGIGLNATGRQLLSPTSLASTSFGLNAAGEQTRGALAAGKSDAQALGIGTGAGLVEAGLEKVGLDKYLGTGGNLARRLGTRMLTEGAQEASQSLAQSGFKDAYANVDWRDAFTQAGVEGVFGAAVGGIGSAPVDIAQSFENRGGGQQQQQPFRGNPAVAELRNTRQRQQRQYDNAPSKTVKNQIARAIQNTQAEINRIMGNEAGFIRIPGGKDTTLNDQQLAVLNHLNQQPQQEGSATRGEGNAQPIQISQSKRQQLMDSMKKLAKDEGGFVRLPGQQDQNIGKRMTETELKKLVEAPGIGEQTPNKLRGTYRVKNVGVSEIGFGASPDSKQAVDSAVRAIRDGKTLPPILVKNSGDGSYEVIDGNHRLYAYQKEGVQDIPVLLQESEQGSKIVNPQAFYGQQPKKPEGFILAETKARNGRKDTVRVKKDPNSNRLIKTRQSEIDPKAQAIGEALGLSEQEIANAEKQGSLPYADKVAVSKANKAAGPKGKTSILEQKTREALTPPKTLKDQQTKNTFVEATKRYLGERQASALERQATVADLNNRYDLTDNEKINAIQAADDSRVRPINQKVAKYLQDFRALTDTAYADYTQNKGLEMGYQKDYLPRIYKNPDTGQEVDRAEFELLMKMSGRLRGREADSLYTDALVEKDPTKLLKRYYSSLDRVAAGRQYLSELEKGGVLVRSDTPVRGLRPVLAEGLQPGDGSVYYANKDVSDKLNKIFGDNQANNFVEKTLEKAEGVNSLMQSFVLSGGVPNTPLNAFGVMQVMKEGMALHPVKAGRALMAGLNKKSANKLFSENKEYLKMMARNDIDMRVNLEQTAKTGTQRIAEAEGAGAKLNQAWNEFTNDATFGRFMPALELIHFKNVYNQQIRRNKSEAEAERIAAASTRNFYGKTGDYKQETRAKATDDALGAFLFAPRFRESMLNFWGKNVQALNPKNITKTEYRENQKFLVASALTFAAMNALQNALTGDDLWENPEGKKDKLIIPGEKLPFNTNDKDIGIPFLPSIATVPRNAIQGVGNLVSGNLEEAGKNAASFASMPLKTLGELFTNQNYFGQRIIDEDATAPEKFSQAGSYIVKNNMQPWIREGLNTAGQNLPEGVKKSLGIKEKSGAETASNALELPFRFYDPNYYKKDGKFVNRQGQNKTVKRGDSYVKLADLPLGERFQESLKDLGESGDSDSIRQMVGEIDGEMTKIYDKWGLPPLPTTTEIADKWADFDKKVRSGKTSDIELKSEEKRLLRNTYKTQANSRTQDFLSVSSDSDMRTAIQDGLVDQKTLDEAIQLDNFLVDAGLLNSPYIGNTLRRELGYASKSKSSRSSGRGRRGGKTKIAMPGNINVDVPKPPVKLSGIKAPSGTSGLKKPGIRTSSRRPSKSVKITAKKIKKA